MNESENSKLDQIADRLQSLTSQIERLINDLSEVKALTQQQANNSRQQEKQTSSSTDISSNPASEFEDDRYE